VSLAVVTGAGGFIGSHLVLRLLGDGWRVKVLARDAPARGADATLDPGLGLESSEDRWAAALEGADVVFHLAGIAHRRAPAEVLELVNEHSPARLYEAAARAGVARFVWLSSIKVLGEKSAEPLREDSARAPVDAYGASKAAGEARLLAQAGRDTAVAVVRPPMVYGPGVKANFRLLLALARLAGRGVPLPFGDATAPRSLLGVTNLCDFLMRVAACGEGVLHVADPEDLSVAELLRVLTGKPDLRLPAIPRRRMRTLFQAVGRRGDYTRLFEPFRLDSRVTREALSWEPPQSGRRLLKETMAWYRQR
jgi:UDP-glucose 4-epimerase